MLSCWVGLGFANFCCLIILVFALCLLVCLIDLWFLTVVWVLELGCFCLLFGLLVLEVSLFCVCYLWFVGLVCCVVLCFVYFLWLVVCVD